MQKKKRYIVGHRYGPRLDHQSDKELQSFLSSEKEAKEIRRTPVGRRILELTDEQASELAKKNPQLVIEEDEELELFGPPGLPSRVPMQGTTSFEIEVKDAKTKKPIEQVTIYGIGAEVTYKAITNADGKATIKAHEPVLKRIMASPRDGYWSRLLPGAEAVKGKMTSMELKPLLLTGSYAWGHQLMGFQAVNQTWTGANIKVGVIDSGISDQHPDLKPSGGYSCIDNEKDWSKDEKGHGTHVSGIIAAQNNKIGILGGAPQAQISSIKVFPGGYISDLIEGVEWCIQNNMDVINLSLGSEKPSQVLAGVLRDAYDRGITCVAAAGNDATHVAYPAAHPTVLAVGAMGKLGTFPQDSAHVLKINHISNFQSGLFMASFSNYGPEVDLCAPGVAILSTVPSSGYASWDGTSMAAPMVTALVALILEAYPSTRVGNPWQVETIRSMLANACVNLGMPPLLQGRGLPLATNLLAGARPQATPGFFDFNTMPQRPAAF